MTVRIDEDELFVGNFTSKIRGGAIAPELKGQWLLDELDTLSTRPFDRYEPLSREELDILHEYLPYWRGKAAFEHWQAKVPPEYQRLDHIMVATGGYAENGHHWAHTAADYEKLLRVGSLGLIAEAEEKIAALDYTDPTAQDRRQFYLAVQVVHRGWIRFAQRYAELAERLAAEESDPVRKAELERISVTCRKVPARPADDLFEAVQSCWLLYVALMIEGWGAGPTLGRADQYLYPFYQKDKAGRAHHGCAGPRAVFPHLYQDERRDQPAKLCGGGRQGRAPHHAEPLCGRDHAGRPGRGQRTELSLPVRRGRRGPGRGGHDDAYNRLNPNSYVKHAWRPPKSWAES